LTNLLDYQTVTGNDTKMETVEKGLSGLYVAIVVFLQLASSCFTFKHKTIHIYNIISYPSPGNNNFVLLQ